MAHEPDVLEFGEVPIGATKYLTLKVSNTGTADLIIEEAQTDAPFGAVILDEKVRPGQNGVVDVAFRPTNNEEQQGTLVLASNDPDNPSVSISLTGVGVAGTLVVRPTLVDFSNTAVGEARSVEILVSNLGLEDEGGDLYTERFQRPEHFSLTSLSDMTQTAPFAVLARSELLLDLVYRPLDLGQDNGHVVFEICGHRCGLEVQVMGSATQAVVRLQPGIIDFGGVGIGTKETQQLLVENIGTDPVRVTSVSTVGGTEIMAAALANLPTTIEGGRTLGINVDFTPSVAGSFQGQVVVGTTDPIVPEARAQVVGEGEGPLFSVVPSAISFGVERAPGTYQRALLLVNAGSSEVRVNGVSIGGDPELSLAPLPGFPLRLGSGESLVVQAVFTPTQQGEYHGTITVLSDDPANPSIDVPVAAGMSEQLCELALAPTRVNFGLLPPGFVRQKSATFTNIGTSDCTILSGDFRAPVDPVITMSSTTTTWPFTIAPNNSFALDFQFAPTQEVESKSNYTMMTDDPVFPERHLTLVGTAAGYVDVFTDPRFIDFGSVLPNCSAGTRTVNVLNAGTVDVEITAISLNVSTNEFTLNNPNRMPYLLEHGTQTSFEVSYIAADIGQDVGDVEVMIKDMPFPLIVPIQGEGTVAPRILDSYQQSSEQKADILFVIDDSCSMGDDQQALAQNFSHFIRHANLRNIDFQIGIARTTLHPIPGKLEGPVMTSQTRNLQREFESQASVGSGGSGFEQGLEAMSAALSLPANASLYRANAGLVVVIVSDEDDQSQNSTLAYYNDLRQHASSGFMTAVVSGQAAGCTSVNTGPATPAPRYEDFVQISRGLSESICVDWASTLSNIGSAAFGLRTIFRLSQGADQNSPINVTVDGQAVHNWTYDAQTAAIIFDAPPTEGSTIQVEYTPVC